VLAAVQRLAARGGSAGPQEVYAELKHDPDLPLSVSHDAVRLADLMQACPRASHAPAYAGLVIGGRIRRDLALEGGRVRQAASPPEAGPVSDEVLESARLAVASARAAAVSSCARWERLPAEVRRELPVPARADGGHAELARRAGRVRDELARLREDLWAQDGDRIAGRLAAICHQMAEQLAGSDPRPGLGPVGAGSQPDDRVAEAAGLAALRDLIAEPGTLGYAIGWLESGHFANAAQGTAFDAVISLARAGMPIDPVTVSWEAERRGVRIEPRALSGGYGLFARTNLTQVYRRAVLAQTLRAGLETQASAADPAVTVGALLAGSTARLAAAERDLAPERCRIPDREAAVLPLRAASASRPAVRADGERGLEAAL
jgi:DnaB helicase-like protein